MSARLLALLSLIGVLVLDGARSYHARTAVWTVEPPAAETAKAVTWPPGSDLPADAPLGEQVYARHCAACHGPDGKGDGPAAPALNPRPRDFSRGAYKFKSTASGLSPRLSDIRRSIRAGIAGTSMPAWKDLLTDEEVDAVAEHIRGFGPIERWTEDGESSPLPADIFTNADGERGKERYQAMGCPACHGPEGRGDGPAAPDLRDVWKQPVTARDLTAPWTYRWGTDRATVYHWIAHGLGGTPMPGYLEVVEPQEIADVVAYLESIARRPPWNDGAASEVEEDPARRGEYLVRAGMCSLCHTPVDAAGIYRSDTLDLAGGTKIEAGAHGIFFSANLTPDDETGLGNWSEAQIAAAIQTGHTRDRRLSFWAMPWQVYGGLAPTDALAIAAYLKALPPVRNRIPEPLYFGSLETVLRKLWYPWPAVPPERLVYAGGNRGSHGSEGGGARDHAATQAWLVRGQRALLVLAAVAWWVVRRRGRGESRHGGASMTTALLVVVGVAAVAFIERYPALGPIPPGPIVGAFAEGIPAVAADDAAPRLRQRGRYLFAISSCAFCHNGDGGGGNKISWRAMGTAWSANLTPHADGLASWSDDDIVRVLRSGVRPDGRQMHWQAMPWDSFSNYGEEDLRSLVAYVRGLPPRSAAAPAPLNPARDDCADYTFWVRAGSDRGGCE